MRNLCVFDAKIFIIFSHISFAILFFSNPGSLEPNFFSSKSFKKQERTKLATKSHAWPSDVNPTAQITHVTSHTHYITFWVVTPLAHTPALCSPRPHPQIPPIDLKVLDRARRRHGLHLRRRQGLRRLRSQGTLLSSVPSLHFASHPIKLPSLLTPSSPCSPVAARARRGGGADAAAGERA
jgi:hypothetical protein